MDTYAKTDNFILQEIGARLKNERVYQGLSQEELSNQSGVSRVSISKMESGENFNFITFIKIMRALNKLQEVEQLLNKTQKDELQELFK
jgi:transcriptional regulator with XRE-family HTH domain